jgi:hypothetical protein
VLRNRAAWPAGLDADPPPSPAELREEIAALGGLGGWIVQTYLQLKRRGHDVRIVSDFVRGAICVVHFAQLRIRDLTFDCYVVAVRADRPPVWICEERIVQNPEIAPGPRDHYVPYWPQPGLVPRDPARGCAVRRVGFAGRRRNLAERFRAPEFEAALNGLGLEFVLREERWWDYSDLDVVLAVRDGRPEFLATKPASKLVNSWLAGCPALLGPEPAFAALRRSPLDYVEVSTPERALAELRRLRDDPGVFRAMVENGRTRGREFDAEHVVRRWEQLLAGPVAEGYERWRERSRGARAARFAARVGRQLLEPRRLRR